MLRVGIVGAGIRGTMYTRALREVPGIEVAGIADPADRAAERARDELGVQVYPSHRELFDRERLDAAIVATPDHTHRAPAVDAARAGLHLLVEKPLATSTEDAEAIRDAVRGAGVECMVAFENRWNPSFVRAREAVASGEVGDVLTQSARLSNTYFVPTRMLSWAGSSSPGWFLMTHIADLALWFSGHEPTRVYATGLRRELRARGVDTWDAIHALVTFDDGSVASLESLWVLPDSMPSIVDFKYQIVGSRSAVFVDQQDQMSWQAGEQFVFPRTLLLEVDGRPQGFSTWMAQSFARRLIGGERLEPTVEDGLRVTRLIEAVHRSLDSGSPESIGPQG